MCDCVRRVSGVHCGRDDKVTYVDKEDAIGEGREREIKLNYSLEMRLISISNTNDRTLDYIEYCGIVDPP